VADPSTTPVSPFNPAAVQVPRDGPGCSKPLLIGCGLLILLAGAGLLVIRFEAPAIFRWVFRMTEASMTPRLPADATPAERRRLHQAFESAGRSIGGDQTDLATLQRVQGEIMALNRSQAPLTHQEVRELTEALEALSHPPPAPPAAPGTGIAPTPGGAPPSPPSSSPPATAPAPPPPASPGSGPRAGPAAPPRAVPARPAAAAGPIAA
jgi:hypothetical protein